MACLGFSKADLIVILDAVSNPALIDNDLSVIALMVL